MALFAGVGATSCKQIESRDLIREGNAAYNYGQYAEAHWLKQEGGSKVWPQTNWAKIYDLMQAPLDYLRQNGHAVIMTSRIKEQYVKEKPTGIFVPRLSNRLLYLSDLTIQADEEDEWQVTKSAWHRKGDWPSITIPKEGIDNVLEHVMNDAMTLLESQL